MKTRPQATDGALRVALFSATEPMPGDAAIGLQGDRVRRQVSSDLSRLEGLLAEAPDVLVLGGFATDERLIAAISSLSLELPACAIILSVPQPSPEMLIRLMQAGVGEVLPSLAAPDLRAALERARARSRPAAGRDAAPLQGRLVGFVSAKGGDGATCVLANLAVALARGDNGRIALIDLALPFGDLQLFLTAQEVRHDLAEFVEQSDRLDSALFDAMALHVGPELRLVPSPVALEPALELRAESVARLLDVALRSHPYVLLDLGDDIDPLVLALLERLDRLVVVADLTVASLRRTCKVLGVWSGLGRGRDEVEVVLNRVGASPDVPLHQFEKAAGVAVSRQLPVEDDGVRESLLQGTPVLDVAPDSAFSRSIRNWAAEWAGHHQEERSLWARFRTLLKAS